MSPELPVLKGIYGLINPITGELRYIGLSKDIHTRYKAHLDNRSKKAFQYHLYKWLRSIPVDPELIILELTEDLAEAEMFYIEYYKSIGCRLVNGTVGGDGINGYKFSDEQKLMISEKTKEAMAKLSPEKKAKMRTQIGKGPKKKIIDSLGNIFTSMTEAAKYHKISIAAISLIVSGITKNPTSGILFKRII